MVQLLFPEQLLFHLSWLAKLSDPEVEVEEEEEEGNEEEDDGDE